MRLLQMIAFAVLASATLVEAQTATEPKAAKGAATPEEAVDLMVKAAKAGDVDATFALLIDEQGRPLSQWLKAQEALAKSINLHVEALETAFGKDETSPAKKISFDIKKELSNGFGGYEVVGKPTMVDDDAAKLNVKTTMTRPEAKPVVREQMVGARKTGAGWKLVFDAFDQVDFPRAVTIMDALRTGIDRTTKGVKDGTIKDRAGAMKEVEKDNPKSVPGNVPLPRFLTS